MKTMAFQSPGFSRCLPDFKNVINQVDCASDMFAYICVRMYRTHEVGKYKGIPKESGLETKMRPLGSYSRHALRNLLSLGSRALVYCVFLHYGYSDQGYTNERSKHVPIPILSVQPAIQSLNAQRLHWMQMQEHGFDMVRMRKKVDLNDFFGRVPRNLV